LSTSNGQLPWWVYILRLDGTRLYTGVTTSMERRIMQHRGELRGGARFTRGRALALAYCREVGPKSLAYRLEYRIKKLSRRGKERIIAEDMSIAELATYLALPDQATPSEPLKEPMPMP
jgi:putative endonuclease